MCVHVIQETKELYSQGFQVNASKISEKNISKITVFKIVAYTLAEVHTYRSHTKSTANIHIQTQP